jgi:hypothetical protein
MTTIGTLRPPTPIPSTQLLPQQAPVRPTPAPPRPALDCFEPPVRAAPVALKEATPLPPPPKPQPTRAVDPAVVDRTVKGPQAQPATSGTKAQETRAPTTPTAPTRTDPTRR